MRRLSCLLIPATLLLSAPALAKDKDPAVQPQVFQAVVDCRKLTDSAARLACYDASVAALAGAAEAKQVLVVDRATTEKTKRSLFGLSLPKIKLFGDNDDVEIEKIESTITSVSSARDGSAIFVLADGARWKQTEGRDTFAKAGQKIEITKGSLGSYFARINGQSGVRVIRLPQS
ncbi:MAG: hypothetical protein RL299_880 [Pseudomonadota bacterium]|jgi:hypothetical protein